MVDIIINNAKKRGGTASFKSSVERTAPNERKVADIPPVGFYDFNKDGVEPKKRNQEFDLSKLIGRSEALDKEGMLVYKSLLDNFNYSSFKNIVGSMDFSKHQPR